MPRYQTLVNDNKHAMLDCVSGLHQSEDERNCHIYVTSIMTITFIVFAQKEYIVSCCFSLVPLV